VRACETQTPTILVQDEHNFSEASKVKKVAIYARVSTPDQHIETQLYDLRKLAAQRGFAVTREYCDRGISGSKARRPGLDSMLNDARRGEFAVVLVAAFDRIARSTKNFLEIVDELNSVNIEFVSAREAIDTSGPMGRMFLTMVGSIAELERSLIVERIKAGMRRAKIEGRRLGRTPLNVDRNALVRDRLAGMSLTDVAKKYRISRASVVRVVRQAKQTQMVAA
jgi:DNA invertase Pin-like site-specific DNA recombinase